MGKLKYKAGALREFCKCGCNNHVSTGKDFLQGHHVRAFRLLMAYARGEVKGQDLPGPVRTLARINGIKFNAPLPKTFPKFRNRYTKT